MRAGGKALTPRPQALTPCVRAQAYEKDRAAVPPDKVPHPLPPPPDSRPPARPQQALPPPPPAPATAAAHGDPGPAGMGGEGLLPEEGEQVDDASREAPW